VNYQKGGIYGYTAWEVGELLAATISFRSLLDVTPVFLSVSVSHAVCISGRPSSFSHDDDDDDDDDDDPIDSPSLFLFELTIYFSSALTSFHHLLWNLKLVFKKENSFANNRERRSRHLLTVLSWSDWWRHACIFLIGKVIAEDFDLQYVLGDRFVSRWEKSW